MDYNYYAFFIGLSGGLIGYSMSLLNKPIGLFLFVTGVSALIYTIYIYNK